MANSEDHSSKVDIPRGAFLLLLLFLLVVAGLWANVYLRVIWRA